MGLLYSTPLIAQEAKPEWYETIKKIKLLSSTDEDIAKLFRKPVRVSSERKYAEYVDTSDGRFFFGYASGLCVVTEYSAGKPMGWKVPEWTVIDMSFTPLKGFKPRRLPFSSAGFRSYEVHDVPGAYVHESDALGISYSVHRNGKVESISFDPPVSMNHLHC